MIIMTALDATTSGGPVVDCNSSQGDSTVADSISVFPKGSIVKCTTRIPTVIGGQVICYDNQARMLVLSRCFFQSLLFNVLFTESIFLDILR